jgi:putative ABC transport system permease protein
MKRYLDLIHIYAKVHKRQSRMTRICIVLAVFLVTAIFGMADMEMRSQQLQAKKRLWKLACDV